MSEQPYKANKQVNQVVRPLVASAPAQKTETVAIPAGAQGTYRDFQLKYRPILDSTYSDFGGKGDTSVVLSSNTAFTTEVPYGKPDADMAEGEYYINYVTGKGRGRKADASTSMVASYYVLGEADDDSASTATRTTVTPATSSALLIAANPNRKGLKIVHTATDPSQNNWFSTVNPATSSNFFTRLIGSGELSLYDKDEWPYTGEWRIISDVASGTMQVIELT